MNNKGISLIALVITIVVLLILASITFEYGKESIDNAKLESLKTNMLLIKAKTKEYVEQANFKAGTSNEYKNDEGQLKTEIAQELVGTPETNSYSYISLEEGQYLYNITDNLSEIGLKDVSISGSEKYLVRYDIKNANVEVYNTKGFKVDGTTVYDLTNLQK